MLLHTKRYLPEAITPILWPFAVAEAINMENQLSTDKQGCTPLQRLTVLILELLMTVKHYSVLLMLLILFMTLHGVIILAFALY